MASAIALRLMRSSWLRFPRTPRLSKSLGDVVRRGHLVGNPVLAVSPPGRDDSVERAAWNRDEVVRLLEVASRDRLAAIWRLALTSGLRRGEILGLTWDDLDGNVVSVARQVLVRPAGGYTAVYVRNTTKTRRVRRVRIDDATAVSLRRWKAAQSQERLAFGIPWRTAGGLGVEAAWIVTEPDGSVVHPATFGARGSGLSRPRASRRSRFTAHGTRWPSSALGRCSLDVVSPARARQHHHHREHLLARLRQAAREAAGR
jgi:integrase